MPPKSDGAALKATLNTSSISSKTAAALRNVKNTSESAASAPKLAYIAPSELALFFLGMFTLNPGHEFVTAIYNDEQKLLGKLFRATDGTLVFVSAIVDAYSPECLFESVRTRLLEFNNCDKFIFFTERTKERDISTDITRASTKIQTQLADIIVIQKTTTALTIKSYLDHSDSSDRGLTDDSTFEENLKAFCTTQYPSLRIFFEYQGHVLRLNTNDIYGTHFQSLVRQLVRAECRTLEHVNSGFFNICRNKTDMLEVLIKFAREYIPASARFAPLKEMALDCGKTLSIDSLLQLDVSKAFQWFIALLTLAGYTVEQPYQASASAAITTSVDHNIALVVTHPYIKQGKIAIVRPHQDIGNEQDFKGRHQLTQVIHFNIKEHFFETIRVMLYRLGVVIETPENFMFLFKTTPGSDIITGEPINEKAFGALADYNPTKPQKSARLKRHTSQLLLDPASSLAVLRDEKDPGIQQAKSSLRLAAQAQYFDNQLSLNALTLKLITVGILYSNGFKYDAEKKQCIQEISKRNVTLFNLHDYDSFDAFFAEFNCSKSPLKSNNHVCFIPNGATTYPYVIFCKNGELTVYLLDTDRAKLALSVDAQIVAISAPDQALEQTLLDGFTQAISQLPGAVRQTAGVDLSNYEDVSLSFYNQGVSLTNHPHIEQKNFALVQLFNQHKVTGLLQQAYEDHQKLIHSCFKAGLLLCKKIEDADGNHLAYVFKYPLHDEMAIVLHPTDPSSILSLSEEVITTAVNAALAGMPAVTADNTKILVFTVGSGAVKLALTEPGSQIWQAAKTASDLLLNTALAYMGINQDRRPHFSLTRPLVCLAEKTNIDIKLTFGASSAAEEDLWSPLSPLAATPAADIRDKPKSVFSFFKDTLRRSVTPIKKQEQATVVSPTKKSIPTLRGGGTS